MDQLEATPIRGTEGAPPRRGRRASPFFSPDGRWIGFWQSGQIKKVSITGGAPLDAVCSREPMGRQLDEREHDSLRAERAGRRQGRRRDLARIERRRKAGAPGEGRGGEVAEGPQMLPGGRAILFTLARARRLGYGADRRPVARHRQAPCGAGAWRRRTVCADRSSRLCAWRDIARGAL